MNLRLQLLNRWDEIRNSYWFLPAMMAASAAVLSLGTLHFDVQLNADDRGDAWWVYTGSASGARAVLQTIATSMIGVAGVVFSITTVTLTLAANKFGPRIFRNFMADTGNQVVLGTFTSTFLFCLLILRQVRGTDNAFEADRFIPQISLLVAVMLAICSLGVLIYFIHHVAASIQTSNVVAMVGRDLQAGIRELYPEQVGQPVPDSDDDTRFVTQVPPNFQSEAVPILSVHGGYIRRVESDALLHRATESELLVRMDRHPGDFISADEVLLWVWPADQIDDEWIEEFRSAVVIGDQRTPAQDIRFPIGQLTEVACLALSSGVNDLYTALLCIDRLGEGLALLAGRSKPSAYRADKQGALRVIASVLDLAALLEVAFDPILQNAVSQPLVMERLFDAFARIAKQCHRMEDQASIQDYAQKARQRATGPDEHRLNKLLESVVQSVHDKMRS